MSSKVPNDWSTHTGYSKAKRHKPRVWPYLQPICSRSQTWSTSINQHIMNNYQPFSSPINHHLLWSLIANHLQVQQGAISTRMAVSTLGSLRFQGATKAAETTVASAARRKFRGGSGAPAVHPQRSLGLSRLDQKEGGHYLSICFQIINISVCICI